MAHLFPCAVGLDIGTTSISATVVDLAARFGGLGLSEETVKDCISGRSQTQ